MLNLPEQDIDRLTEVFYTLLRGRLPKPIALPDDYPDNEIRQATEYLNQFIAEYVAFSECLTTLSRGELDFEAPKGRLLILQSLKNLQANLRHLTWKTQQIAGGDFTQTVDFMGDFSEAFNRMTQQLKYAFERIEHQNQALSEANDIILREKEKSERLLLNILPESVAQDLKQTGHTAPQLFENVTVLFSDIVGFTKQSSELAPRALIDELNSLFTAFDTIIEAHRCERIKTIGDAYLAVCGMPRPDVEHTGHILDAAAAMLRYLEERNEKSAIQWQIRVGVHTGPVIGAVVGIKKYIYDVFGDTINTASRMEHHSEPMRVNVSEATRVRAGDGFQFITREPVEVKGKGAMRMHFLDTAILRS